MADLEAGDVCAEEGGKLAATARTLALVTQLVIQHVRLHLNLWWKQLWFNNYPHGETFESGIKSTFGVYKEMSSILNNQYCPRTIYEPRCGSCRASDDEYSCAHGAQINFGDLTPYLTSGLRVTKKWNVRMTDGGMSWQNRRARVTREPSSDVLGCGRDLA